DIQKAKAVTRSPDEIPVLNYRLDGSNEGSFYEVGKPVAEAMKIIFDAHRMDPNIDAAWSITSAGQEVDGVSGRSTADTRNDPDPLTIQVREDSYDIREWLHGDHVEKRKQEIVKGKMCFSLSMQMFDPHNDEHWTPQGSSRIDPLDRLPRGWEPVSKVMTNILRWVGCRRKKFSKGKHDYPIPCDTGGWFLIEDLLQRPAAGLAVTVEMLLNIVL
ncbi:MAG: hypothetical protein GY768_26375, partial [Planctomycetaceae bacterium]|nr:hypothetical protein [Planctomycetaceae bacterium]